MEMTEIFFFIAILSNLLILMSKIEILLDDAEY